MPALSATRAAWFDQDLPALSEERSRADRPTLVPHTRADLLADGAAVLRAAHQRLRGLDVTPQAAATYLAGWYGGIGSVLGRTLGAARAGVLLAPESLTWQLADGKWWAHRVDVRPAGVLVPAGHPWAGQDGVQTAGEDELIARSVQSLVQVCGPLIEARRGLARVARSGLWDEVADGLGCAFAYRGRPVEPATINWLGRAVAVPGVPWKGRPRLANAHSGLLGPVHITQKGGCCLAFNQQACAGPGRRVGRRRPGVARALPARAGQAVLLDVSLP